MNAVRSLTMALVSGALFTASGCYVYYPHYGYASAGHVAVGVSAPVLTPIAGTGIHWAAELDSDVFSYRGRWYWNDGPYWYVSPGWGHAWSYIAMPPLVFLGIPHHHPAYRVVYRHPRHRHYRQHVRKHYAHYQPVHRHRTFQEVRAARRHETHRAPKPAQDETRRAAPSQERRVTTPAVRSRSTTTTRPTGRETRRPTRTPEARAARDHGAARSQPASHPKKSRERRVKRKKDEEKERRRH